jgi:cyclophilin family peptidyl-prolyl cis-trans isomerase
MRVRLILALAGLAAVLAVAGCPRNDGSGGDTQTTPPPSTKAPVATPPASTPPSAAPPANGSTTTPPASGSATTPPATPDGSTPANPATPATPPDKASTPAAGTHVVVLETTKGNIEITVHDDWAPIGAKHFLDLVNAKFYDGAPWFRVLDGFVAQCGVAADPAMNQKWEGQTIQDEPVVQGNEKGMVSFGKTGAPNSRSTHIFINLADNTQSLDPQGFACFGEVTKGMDVAENLTKCQFSDQTALAGPGGMDAFKKMFPNADYINKAYVKP